MSVSISLYKRTDNLSESEPRMTRDWDGFKSGQPYEVPLHDNNVQYVCRRCQCASVAVVPLACPLLCAKLHQ